MAQIFTANGNRESHNGRNMCWDKASIDTAKPSDLLADVTVAV